MTTQDVEESIGCPNASCWVHAHELCVDRLGNALDYPHRARAKIAESIERDIARLGYLPEHGAES